VRSLQARHRLLHHHERGLAAEEPDSAAEGLHREAADLGAEARSARALGLRSGGSASSEAWQIES